MRLLPVRCSAGTLAVLFVLASLARLFACACCSDQGEYRLTTDRPVEGYQLDEVRGMTFTSKATLYQTDAGDDENAKGIDGTPATSKVAVTIEPEAWRFTFRTDNGKTGVLTLKIPATMTAYAADMHDGKKSGGNGPLLYKEWRFEGVATGDGIFSPGFTAPARYTLVFQGHGNRCDNGEDFTYWRLAITGDQADYAFFGKLVATAP